MTCDACHIVPSGVNSVKHIDNALPAEITFVNGLGLINTGAGPVYTGGRCSNTYCHDARNFKNAETSSAWANGADYQPQWVNASYLDGSGDCAMCHGWPPGGGHGSYGVDCSSCHSHVDPGDQSFTTLANRSLHIDGVVQASGGACDSCHGYPPQVGDGKTYQNVEGKGAHLSHTNHLASLAGYVLNASTDSFGGAKWEALCGTCHQGATHEMGASQPNTSRTIAINATDYEFGPGAPIYQGVVGSVGSAKPKTCSNVSCHYIRTPEWESY
jgi:predicted CxxxxCH...CXXCH cytochrome family protein